MKIDLEAPSEYFDWHDMLIHIITIIISSFCFILSLLIVIIHINKSFLRQGFFKVVFSMSIFETFLNLNLIANAVIAILRRKKEEPSYLVYCIAGSIFNFLLTSIITYNIITLIVLYGQSTQKDSLSEKEIDEDKMHTSEAGKYSIRIFNRSFLYIHLISIIVGVVHSTVLAVFHMYGNCLWNLYYIEFDLGVFHQLWNILIFLPHYVLVIVSIPYLFISWNKSKITEHIRLRHYAIYNIFLAIFCVVFPIGMLLASLWGNKSTEWKIALKYSVSGFLFVLLLKSALYRVSCYYVQSILSNQGSDFCSRCLTGLKIFFCLTKIKDLSFVDYNATFIYHSLATTNDFLSESIIPTEGLDVDEIFESNPNESG